MKYSFSSVARYSETGTQGSLTIPAIINYFQDCSTFHSEYLHVGIDYLRKTGLVWMLNTWHIEFREPVLLGEQIQIHTWAYRFDSVFGYRNFCITDQNGRNLVQADTKWVLYDVGRHSLHRIEEADAAPYETEEPLQMETAAPKLRKPKESVPVGEIVVPYSFLDTNGHMNNGRYVEVALEYLPKDMQWKTLDVVYKQQALAGDRICTKLTEQEDGITVALTDDADAHLYAILYFRR